MRESSFAVLRPGALFCQRYHVVRCIKAGGMGAVYEVTDERTDGRRALKVMLPEILEDAGLRARFAQEARITGSIESDHIVQVSDAGVDPETDTPFLVMELLRGEDLGSLLAKRAALSRREVMTYLSHAALGLDKTHAAGIVHRDLKPENLFITRRDDGTPCLKILDYGIAKAAASSAQLRSTRVMGTPLYMSPEQVNGEPVGYRADLYALGQITYTLLVGEPYWKGERDGSLSLARFFARVREGVQEPPSARAARRGVPLPAVFDGWFLKATALSPEDRFERATEMISALTAALLDIPFEPVPAHLPAITPQERAHAAPPSSDSGEQLGPYRLVQELGSSGVARTFLAEEVFNGKKLRDVALKLYMLPSHVSSGSPEAARWYDEILDEARALCRVEHPSVVRFYAIHKDRARDLIAIAMEYVRGKSLDVLLREAGRLDERTVIEIGIAVAWALAAVHNAGLIHRDVKPGNILRSPSGYKLIDFGIAASLASPRSPSSLEGDGSLQAPAPLSTPERLAASETAALSSTMTAMPRRGSEPAAPPSPRAGVGDALSMPSAEPSSETRELLDPASLPAGTPGYIAPECVELGAPPSPSTDLYALGATLFRLMTGGPSVTSRGTAKVEGSTLSARVSQPAVPSSSPPASPLSLADITALLLETDPSVRPRHADWVARELERARAELDPPLCLTPSRSSGAPPTAALSAALPPSTVPEGRGGAGGRSFEAALSSRPLLVGRDAPLGALFRAAREVKQGGVRIALITGPQGIGRTRLLEEAIEQAGFDPSRVLSGRASPERKGPLRPLLRALEGRAGALAVVREAIERALAPSPPHASRDGGRDALEEVEEALLWASIDTPLLLALDDLQWGDAHTLDLLRMLVERTSGAGGFHLFVVATVRNEPSPGAALRALLGAARGSLHEGIRHIPLGPLSAGDAALLAQAVSPLALPVEQAVVRGSGGVPFFVVHALLAFRESSAITFQGGAWHAVGGRVLSEDVPGVAELIEARLGSCFDPASSVGRAAMRALAAIALYGGGLGVETVLRVVGGDPEEGERALEALVDGEFVTASGERQEYSFAQEMVRQAVLNMARQRPWFYRLHRALLDAIAEGASGSSDAVFLATGYEKLGARELSREWFERAARACFEAGLFTDAAELGDRLAALEKDPEARARAELDVARALLHGRKFEEVKRRLERLDARGRAPGAAPRASDLRRRIYRLTAAYGLREPSDGDFTIVADADALGDLPLRVEARMALAGVSKEGPAMELLASAVAISALGGPALEHAARAFRLELNHAASSFDRAIAEEDLTEGLTLATATGSTWQSIIIEGDLAILEADLGRVDDAIARLRRLCEKTEAIGMRWQTPIFSQNLSALLLRAGRYPEAAEAAARTAELAIAAGDPVFRGTALSLRADALRRSGELDKALPIIDEAEELQRLRGGRSRALTLLRRAIIHDALGRADEALEDARRAREVAEQYGDRDVAIGAGVLEKLRLSQRGELLPTEVEQAVTEAKSARIRMLTREIVAEASGWLSAREGRYESLPREDLDETGR